MTANEAYDMAIAYRDVAAELNSACIICVANGLYSASDVLASLCFECIDVYLALSAEAS